jgi:hypothetical protein
MGKKDEEIEGGSKSCHVDLNLNQWFKDVVLDKFNNNQFPYYCNLVLSQHANSHR